MSLANVRKHWRFLATVAFIFLVVAAAGPLMVYGLPSLFMILDAQFGNEAILAFGAIFVAFTLGWLFFVLWAGDRADRLTLGSADPEGIDADG